MCRAVRAARPRPGVRRAGRLRGGHRGRQRQLPAQRAARLHRPAGRRREIRPDSGDPERYEGVAGPEVDRRALLASRTPAEDLPRTRYGFPAAPGVLDAARRPFRATGLGLPWYAVHGNHDNMLQGTVVPDGWLRDFLAGAVKYVTPPDGVDAAEILARFENAEGDALLSWPAAPLLPVTPDPGRAPGAPGRLRPRALPDQRPAGRARLHPAQRRPRAPPTTASTTAWSAAWCWTPSTPRRLAGLARRDPAGLARRPSWPPARPGR